MIWFFVIVVIIVVAAGGVWWLQHYFLDSNQELGRASRSDRRWCAVESDSQHRAVKVNWRQSGNVQQVERAFDQLNDDDLADLQKILLDLEDQAKRFRFDHAQKIAKVLEAKIDTAANNMT